MHQETDDDSRAFESPRFGHSGFHSFWLATTTKSDFPAPSSCKGATSLTKVRCYDFGPFSGPQSNKYLHTI